MIFSLETNIIARHDDKGLNQAWFLELVASKPDPFTLRNVTGRAYMDLEGDAQSPRRSPAVALYFIK